MKHKELLRLGVLADLEHAVAALAHAIDTAEAARLGVPSNALDASVAVGAWAYDLREQLDQEHARRGRSWLRPSAWRRRQRVRRAS